MLLRCFILPSSSHLQLLLGFLVMFLLASTASSASLARSPVARRALAATYASVSHNRRTGNVIGQVVILNGFADKPKSIRVWGSIW